MVKIQNYNDLFIKKNDFFIQINFIIKYESTNKKGVLIIKKFKI